MLLEAGAFCADRWRHLGDDEAVPEDETVTVSYARWTRERAALTRRNAPLGLRLPNDVAPLVLGEDVHRFAVIVLDFPRFTDGRAYSQARLLRGRLGYRGSLRAAGNVLRDQLLFMRRCGFDSFEVGERAVAENWLAAFDELDVFFQPGEDRMPWVLRQRRAVA
ncbi:MAG TPA: DUF934 domain-containing protein [Stellaceae bacterium]|nr:DUF934 domain-containing protein [Stellaceae bacterium]